jgi:hypothetical protein
MKFLTLLFFLVSSSAHAFQINLDCHDANQTKMASVYTPTFVYNQLNIKADLEINGELVSLDVPLGHSQELPGVYVVKTEELTVIGIAKTSLFVQDATLQLDILEQGLSVLTLTCKTTINNPAFPRD